MYNGTQLCIKWRQYGTAVILPRTGHRIKVDEKKKKMIKVAVKRQAAAANEKHSHLQLFYFNDIF